MRYLIPVLLLLFVLASCKETSMLDDAGLKKLKPDTDYYCAEAKTWVRFTEVSPELKGYFFVDSGRAVVTRIPFYVHKKGKKFLVFYMSDKLNKAKLKEYEITDSSFTIEGDDRKAVFIAERPVKFPEIKNRYFDEITEIFNKTTVKYGIARGYYNSKIVEKITEDEYPGIIVEVGKSLIKNFLMSDLMMEMDIYVPSGDNCKLRPLLVLFHGGAFMIGDKSSITMKGMAEYFAKRGYVVAVPNYRLGFWFVPGSYYFLERAIYRATQDARASVRYMVTNAGKYGIDTAQIYTGGNSAGGFIAMNVAMMKDDSYYPSRKADIAYLLDDLGCLDCSTNNIKAPFKIKGVINMWGALTHIRMLVENPNLPILCFHGSDDKLIPIGNDYPFANVSSEVSKFFSEKVFGSEIINKYSKVTKTPVTLKVFKGLGHDPNVNDDGSINPCFDTIKTVSRDFLLGLVKPPAVLINGPLNIKASDPVSEYTVTNAKGNEVFWEISGGMLTDVKGSPDKKRVIWFSGANKELKVMLRNRNQAVSLKRQVVRIE